MKAKGSPAQQDISMAQEGDTPHPHKPSSSTWEEESKHLTASLLLPYAISITEKMKETESKDCKQEGQLLLIRIFSLQQGRIPKAALMVCNHQKHWPYVSVVL